MKATDGSIHHITKYGPRLTQDGHEKRKATLQALFDQGLTCDAVAALVGLSAPMVSKLTKGYGITRLAKPCRGCKSLFRPTQANQAFCQPACRRLRKRDRLVARTCAICGTAFRPRDGRQLYCKPNCNHRAFTRRAYYRKRGMTVPADVGAPIAPRTCGTCGGVFTAVNKMHLYCSKACKQRNSGRREYLRRRALMAKAAGAGANAGLALAKAELANGFNDGTGRVGHTTGETCVQVVTTAGQTGFPVSARTGGTWIGAAAKECNEVMEQSRPAFERAFSEACGRILRKWKRLVGESRETIEDE